MYLRCPECKTRYEIPAARIPESGARVRCQRCRTVFHVARPMNGSGLTPPPARPVEPRAPVDAESARRLARALVSDFVEPRRPAQQSARQAGRLLATFGPQIVGAWERYCQRIGPEMARETPFFNEAVNDILGEGDPLL